MEVPSLSPVACTRLCYACAHCESHEFTVSVNYHPQRCVQEDGGRLKRKGEHLSLSGKDWTPLAMIRYLEAVLKVRR